MLKIPFLNPDLNDHIQPKRKFYKTKTFWLSVLAIAGALLTQDYAHAVPLVIDTVNGAING